MAARIVLAIAAIAVVVLGVSLVGSTPARTPAQQLVTVKRGVVQSVVSGSGTLTPKRQSNARFATSGTIASVHVSVGDHVSSGEVLANLDTSTADAQLASAQAAVQNAQDALTSAENPATTSTTAAAKGAASGSGGGSTASVAAAQDDLASAQVTLRNAESALEQTALHAPISGTVASISGSVGDSVGGGASGGSGNGAFAVIAQVHRFKMSVSLTESDIGAVKVGQPATVTVNAADGQEFTAHVSSIGVLASSSSGSSGAVSYPVTLTSAIGPRPQREQRPT